MKPKIHPYAKAVAAFFIAGLGALATGAADNVITLGEAILSLSAGAAAGGAVFGIRNSTG